MLPLSATFLGCTSSVFNASHQLQQCSSATQSEVVDIHFSNGFFTLWYLLVSRMVRPHGGWKRFLCRNTRINELCCEMDPCLMYLNERRWAWQSFQTGGVAVIVFLCGRKAFSIPNSNKSKLKPTNYGRSFAGVIGRMLKYLKIPKPPNVEGTIVQKAFFLVP